jgi:hypothetical protein
LPLSPATDRTRHCIHHQKFLCLISFNSNSFIFRYHSSFQRNIQFP